MSMDSKKSNKIRDIVRLQQIIKKWRKLANKSSNTSSSNSKSIKFLKRTLSLSDNTIREGSSSAVPKGYLAVCVGDELKRFIIPTEYLSHHAFQILLQEAEEEFGFQQSGVLRIPCEVPVFETILKVVEGKKDIFFTQECILNIEEMVGYCSSESQLTHSHHPQSPMCR
ncbi:SAUR-like auxin-responsive family protein [Quillaja saponaria]|uniref:SAUR-like auxin-responsive family protein n=1 Tax=Quillaja saponaria TaxID=32244 RepID=A0AAD7LXJ9_QUISA|nr:SAUR-like auxin-responsive family protein [Quillaja saponaria]